MNFISNLNNSVHIFIRYKIFLTGSKTTTITESFYGFTWKFCMLLLFFIFDAKREIQICFTGGMPFNVLNIHIISNKRNEKSFVWKYTLYSIEIQEVLKLNETWRILVISIALLDVRKAQLQPEQISFFMNNLSWHFVRPS